MCFSYVIYIFSHVFLFLFVFLFLYIAEAWMTKFEYYIDLMTAHEITEKSSLPDMQLVTDPTCQVSMETLTQGIENQGSFSSKKMQKIINTY